MCLQCMHTFFTFFFFQSIYHCALAAYCVVADESVGRQVPMAFLERIKDDFVSRYGGGKAATAMANGLNKEFGYSCQTLELLAGA